MFPRSRHALLIYYTVMTDTIPGHSYITIYGPLCSLVECIIASITEGALVYDAKNGKQDNYRQISHIRCTKSRHWNVSRLVLQLSLPNPLKPCVGVTKFPFVNFSVSKMFDFAKAPVKLFESHSYLTCVTEAELRWHLLNTNAIVNVCFHNADKFGK